MNLFDLFIRVGVDDQASRQVSVLSQSLSTGLKRAAAVGVAAVGTAAAAYVGLTKKAIDAYAEYEQLVGGVETLFGAGGMTIEEYAESTGKSVERVRKEYEQLMTAQETVLTNASRGYLTAGVSANQYMSTITGFAASLKQSLGGDVVAAAELADLALRDMSDNANKMGTDIGMIQNAYSGFARQSFVMLDNLKLGYAGTQTEMRRLIRDAAALDDSIDANSMSFANIVRAINVVQTELGITGTTSKEAATTITGSTDAAKAAWSNLAAGLADDEADIDALVKDFAGSVVTVGENLIPRVAQIGESVIGLMKNYGNVALNYVKTNAPGWWNTVQGYVADELPSDVAEAKQYAANFINSAANAIGNEENQNNIRLFVSNFGNAINSNNEELSHAVANFIGKFAGFITEKETVETVVGAISGLVENAAFMIGDIGANVGYNLAKNIAEEFVSTFKEKNPFELVMDMVENFVARTSKVSYDIWRGALSAFNVELPTFGDAFDNIFKTNWFDNIGKKPTQSYTSTTYDYSKMTSIYSDVETKRAPSTAVTIPNVSINVNASEYSDVDSIIDAAAEKAAGEIQNALERKLAVYG